MEYEASASSELTELFEKVVNEHSELSWIKEVDIRVGVLESNKAKTSGKKDVLGECKKVDYIYKAFCPYDFLIIIYAPNCLGLTDEQMEILMFHECLHIGMNDKNGEPVYVINPHDVEEFDLVIEKYGVHWEARR